MAEIRKNRIKGFRIEAESKQELERLLKDIKRGIDDVLCNENCQLFEIHFDDDNQKIKKRKSSKDATLKENIELLERCKNSTKDDKENAQRWRSEV